MRISFEQTPAQGITVHLIRAWERGDIEEPVMSTSSGPKDMTCNRIWSLFEQFPGIARVMMVRGEFACSIPFLIATNYAGHSFDMAGEAVLIEP